MKDFKIQDNLIVEKGRISAVFEVEPFDVALLSKEDRKMFYHKVRQAFNILPSQVQIISVKENAKISDYAKHFHSITKETEKGKETLTQNYINELSILIETGDVLILKYYFIFSVNANTRKSIKLIEGVKKLNDNVERFTGVLFQAGVTTRQLEENNLVKFIRSQMRE